MAVVEEEEEGRGLVVGATVAHLLAINRVALDNGVFNSTRMGAVGRGEAGRIHFQRLDTSAAFADSASTRWSLKPALTRTMASLACCRVRLGCVVRA